MIHSEDREDIRLGIQLYKNSQNRDISADEETLERIMIARFRCLLDNTCGFIVGLFGDLRL
jgi:hypothetical protein